MFATKTCGVYAKKFMTKFKTLTKVTALIMAVVLLFSMSVTSFAASADNSSAQEAYHLYAFGCDKNGVYELDVGTAAVPVYPGERIRLFNLEASTGGVPKGLKHVGYTCNGESYDIDDYIVVTDCDLYLIAQYEMSGFTPEAIVHYITMVISNLFIDIFYLP